MPRAAGTAASRLHGNAAGQVAVGASEDVDSVSRQRDDVIGRRCHGTASLTRLGDHCARKMTQSSEISRQS